MFALILFLLQACGGKELSCDNDVLQECDADGNCTVVTDCGAEEQVCHDMGENSHCMPAGAMDSGV